MCMATKSTEKPGYKGRCTRKPLIPGFTGFQSEPVVCTLLLQFLMFKADMSMFDNDNVCINDRKHKSYQGESGQELDIERCTL